MWPKLRWSSSSSPRSGEAPPMARERTSKSQTPLTVEEEYNMALRTESFLDLWAKAHHHNKAQQAEAEAEAEAEKEEEKRDSHPSSSAASSSCSSSYHHTPSYNYGLEFILEPSQDSLRAAAAACVRHSHRALLLDYFDTTFEACGACVALLSSLDRARRHHRAIRRLLLGLSLSANSFDGGDNRTAAAFEELARHVDELDNPLSPQSLARLHRAHARYAPLVLRLTAAHRRILRRARLARGTKRGCQILLLGACAAAAAAAMPGRPRGSSGARRREEAAAAEVDAAAKGAYIVGRDLDTVSRMVRRAHDEVEHGRDVARIALRACGGGDGQLAREAAREVEGGAAELAEQLAELEEHVCLCLITINRSRRLVAREITTTTTRHGRPAEQTAPA